MVSNTYKIHFSTLGDDDDDDDDEEEKEEEEEEDDDVDLNAQ